MGGADVEAGRHEAAAAKKKSSCCAKCCKCYCCCCCCCLLLLVIGLIVVFNTVLKVDAKDPPAPPSPIADVMLEVSYSGSDPNSDATFKSNLVSGILSALPGNFVDSDGSIANSLQFRSSRRLEEVNISDVNISDLNISESSEWSLQNWTAWIRLADEAAIAAMDELTGSSFTPSSIPNVSSVTVSGEMTVLSMGHLLKGLNFVCKAAIGKAIDENRGEITDELSKKNVTNLEFGITEDGWIWTQFTKVGWQYSSTALGCEATQNWEKALKFALDLELGACALTNEGVRAVVATGKGGDECYFDSVKNSLNETQLEQCPETGRMCTDYGEEACLAFEYPGCSLCPTPSSVNYLPCNPLR